MNNQVILLGYYGGDETHCLAAWQSTNVSLDIELPEKIQDRIAVLFEETVKTKKKSPAELLRTLALHLHHTPFEASTLHFQVTADVASHIHLLKHRIGVSQNAESARYKELSDKWYVPDDWHSVGCSGDHKAVQLLMDTDYAFTWGDVLDQYNALGHSLYHAAANALTSELGRKRAKESARYFLPYSKQIDSSAVFNFRSFMHFHSLRNSPHAQKEIQELAQSMLTLVQGIPGNPFQYSLEAFGFGGIK